MAPYTALCMQDLTADDMNKLTRVLQIRPQEDPVEYGNRVPAQIATLPTHLRKAKLLPGLLLTDFPPAPLCKFHKNLNSRLTRSIFEAVSEEVGQRCNILIANGHILTSEQRTIIVALRQIHSMWLDRTSFKTIFLEEPTREWPYQRDQCEACMLSRIGGNLDILTTLRIVLLARTRTKSTVSAHCGQPCLLQFVDQWIYSHGHRALDQIDRSNREGAELKIVRKQMCKARRHRRRASTGNTTFGLSSSGASSMDEEFGSGDPEERATVYSELISDTYSPFHRPDSNEDYMKNTGDEQLVRHIKDPAEPDFQGKEFRETHELDHLVEGSNTEALLNHANEEKECYGSPKHRPESTQSYVAPRSNWTRLRNLLQNEPSAPPSNAADTARPSSQMYTLPAVSDSWNTVTSVYIDDVAAPRSTSPYMEPRQIWEHMRAQTMHQPNASSIYSSDQPLSQSSTISVPYPEPLRVRRGNTTGEKEAESGAQISLNLPAWDTLPTQVPGTAPTASESVSQVSPASPHPLDNDREYAEFVAAGRRERERLCKWAQAPSSVALHNISVASLHPGKKGMMRPQPRNTRSANAAVEGCEERPGTSWSIFR